MDRRLILMPLLNSWTRSLSCLLAVAMTAAGPASYAGEQESQLLAILSASTSSDHDKALACEKLAEVGVEASVEPLASLLADPKFSHYARYGLQSNPYAGEALRGALDRLEGKQLIGLINTLAARRDEQAVPQLAKLLRSDAPGVAPAAAGALATIASADALEALRSQPDADGLAGPQLQAAYRLADQGQREEARKLFDQIRQSADSPSTRHAATLGLLKAAAPEQAATMAEQLLASDVDWEFNAGLHGVNELKMNTGTRLLVTAFANASAERRKRILGAFARRGDIRCLSTVRAAAAGSQTMVRQEAVAALGRLGDPSDVDLLTGIALEEDSSLQAAARDALAEIDSDSVSQTLATMLSDPGLERGLLAADVLGRRRAVGAAPVLLELAETAESPEMRVAALNAIKRIGAAELMLELLDYAAKDIDPQERKLAEEAAIAAALKSPDRELAARMLADRIVTHPPEQRRMLFLALRAVGGADALEIVSRAATGGDRELQDHATRVLGAWLTPDAADVLLQVASTDNPFRIRALRGYLRIPRQLNVNLKQKVEMSRKALELADRADERELALVVLSRTPTVDSLRLAQSVLDAYPTDAAIAAVIDLAEQLKHVAPEVAQAAAKQVAEANPSSEVLRRAQAVAREEE